MMIAEKTPCVVFRETAIAGKRAFEGVCRRDSQGNVGEVGAQEINRGARLKNSGYQS